MSDEDAKQDTQRRLRRSSQGDSRTTDSGEGKEAPFQIETTSADGDTTTQSDAEQAEEIQNRQLSSGEENPT
jgi:hypothetical protein